MVRRIYVEKKEPLRQEAAGLLKEINTLLGITALTGLRVFNRYDAQIEEEALFAGSNVMVKRPSNALHACDDGYGQWADCEYFFLKYLLNQGLVK